MKNNQYPKMFVPSDHMKAERRWWSRLAIVAFCALMVLGFFTAAYIQENEYAIAIEMEAGR